MCEIVPKVLVSITSQKRGSNLPALTPTQLTSIHLHLNIFGQSRTERILLLLLQKKFTAGLHFFILVNLFNFLSGFVFAGNPDFYDEIL